MSWRAAWALMFSASLAANVASDALRLIGQALGRVLFALAS